MIIGFASRATGRLFGGQFVKKFSGFQDAAHKRLDALDAATDLRDLGSPGYGLEKLKGDRAGQYSIRINDQYRICFTWKKGDAENVEITDYH